MSDATHATERWLSVPGYEGIYEVSDHGNVRSVDRVVRYVDGRTRAYPEKSISVTLNPGTGRRQVTLSRGNTLAAKRIHVLVLEAFVGPRPTGMASCHNDGDLTNDRLDNLRWDTYTANQLDRIQHGRHEQSNKTRCPWGHALAAPNLVPSRLAMPTGQGGRNCLACSRAKSNVNRARARGVDLDFQATSDEHYARLMNA